MSEPKLLTDAELQAWSADVPPADFTSRLLERLEGEHPEDVDAARDDVIPMRLVPEAELVAAPRQWKKVAATALGVAAAAGLVFWLAQPQMLATGEDHNDDQAAAVMVADGTAGEQVAEPSRAHHETSDSQAASTAPPPPRTESSPKPPTPPASQRVPSGAPVPQAPSPPPSPKPAPAPPAPPTGPGNSQAPAAPPAPPQSPATPELPSAAPPPPPSTPEPPAAPALPQAPAAPKAPGLPSIPKPVAPPAIPEIPPPSGPSSVPLSAMGLHLRADQSTRYRLQCKFGDSLVTLVRYGDLDIAMSPDGSEEGLVVAGGQLYFHTEGKIACTVRRRKGGRIEAVLRTPRGHTKATLVPPARRIKLRQ